MKKPKSIRFNGEKIRIEYRSPQDMLGNLGLALFDKSTIWIQEGQTESGERNTALHELCHFLDYRADLDMTEHQVLVLTNMLLGLLKDNPRLIKYLTGK